MGCSSCSKRRVAKKANKPSTKIKVTLKKGGGNSKKR